MILDTSVLIAIIQREPGWEQHQRRLEEAALLRISAGTLQELLVVAHCRAILEPVEALLALLDPDVVPVDATWHAAPSLFTSASQRAWAMPLSSTSAIVSPPPSPNGSSCPWRLPARISPPQGSERMAHGGAPGRLGFAPYWWHHPTHPAATAAARVRLAWCTALSQSLSQG